MEAAEEREPGWVAGSRSRRRREEEAGEVKQCELF
jgi:hypothetical protein